MTATHNVDVMLSVKVTINDPDVVDRCVNNSPDQPGGRGWRDNFYDLRTEADVIAHLAYNCAMNRYHYASELDGWADLPREAATMDITDAETL